MAGIYIHIPFCRKACHYCDFHFSTSLKYKEDMVQALTKEIALRKEREEGEETIYNTLYFGGGTPSLMTGEELQLLINTVKENFKVANDLEITLEINPEDVTKESLAEWLNLGVNRYSVGVQTFDSERLQWMNRNHDRDASLRALELIGQTDVKYSADLIYGMPNQKLSDLQEDVEQLLYYKPEHISCYNLTIEQNTVFGNRLQKKLLSEAKDEDVVDQFYYLHEQLQSQDYIHYEISNYALPNGESKHNSNYWSGGSYLGIGPGAHGFDGKNSRYYNIAHNAKYIKSIEKGELPQTIEVLSDVDKYNEFLLTRLRKLKGFEMSYFKNSFSKRYIEFLEVNLRDLVNSGDILYKNDRVQIAKHALVRTDGIVSELFMTS